MEWLDWKISALIKIELKHEDITRLILATPLKILEASGAIPKIESKGLTPIEALQKQGELLAKIILPKHAPGF